MQEDFDDPHTESPGRKLFTGWHPYWDIGVKLANYETGRGLLRWKRTVIRFVAVALAKDDTGIGNDFWAGIWVDSRHSSRFFQCNVFSREATLFRCGYDFSYTLGRFDDFRRRCRATDFVLFYHSIFYGSLFVFNRSSL